MRSLFILVVVVMAFINGSQSQCTISELTVTQSECDINGNFFAKIDFNHSGTPSPKFKVQGNGQNYGTFSYDSLPVNIGPLKADCKTLYEFVVRDFENSSCTAFKDMGKKCCDNQCKLVAKDVKAGACDSSFYSLKFDLDHNSTGIGFDVFNNGQFFGFYKYSELPLSIPNLKSSNIEPYNQIVICANDNKLCCDTLKIANPCICNIYRIKGQVIDCNEQDSTFSIKFNFKHNLTSDSFNLGGNTKNYGTYAYTDLPITIKGLKFSQSTDYEFLFVDKNDAFCFGSYPLGFVKNCNFPCGISDLKVTPKSCDADGNFFVQLIFNEKNTSIAGFSVSGNGKAYGNFEFGETEYLVGPLDGDCNTLYDFLVKDLEIEGCSQAIALKDSICCEEKCAINNLVVKEFCDGSPLTAFEINFDHKNTKSDMFSLRINDKFIGSFKYADLPIKITDLSTISTKITLKIWDKADESCNLIKEYTFKCDFLTPCKIFDLVVTTSECNDKGEFYAKIKFKHQNTGNKNFGVKVNGVLIDTFPYGHDIYEVGPLKGDCSTLYKFLVYDLQHPDCGDDYVFTEKVCCDIGDCKITDLFVKTTECNDKGEFYAILKFIVKNPGNKGFAVKVNGVLYDSLAYGKELYEIGPLKGDCSTLYKFLVYDIQHPVCSDDYSFSEKVCCNIGDCKITDLLVKASECNDKGEFYAILKFDVKNPGNQGFAVKVNGVLYDSLAYGKESYEIGPLKGDCTTLYKFLIFDKQFDACKDDFSFTEKVCCKEEDCLIKTPLITFSECDGKTYDLLLDFSHSGTSSKFRVKINGAVIGTYNFNELPITIEKLEEKIAHEIFIWDIENEACRLIFSVPGIVCTSGTTDPLASLLSMKITEGFLIVNSSLIGVIQTYGIYDTQGRLWRNDDIQLDEHQIDIQNMPSGMYIISVQIGQNRINKKFIKH